MATYEKRTKFYLLDCLHKVELAEPGPDRGADQFCFKCDKYRVVDKTLVNYRATCLSTCKTNASRNLGDDYSAAEIWARKHVSKYPKHRVGIKKDGVQVAEVDNMGTDLFSTFEDLREEGKKAQELLRETFQAEEIVTYEEGAFPF